MEKTNEEISQQQIIMFVAASMTGCFAYTSVVLERYVGLASWLTIIVSAVIVFPLILWLLHLVRGMQKYSVFDIMERGVGKIIAKGILTIYYFINITLAVALLNIFTHVLKIYFLQNTPTWITMLVILLMCTLFVSSGIDKMGMLMVFLGVLLIVNFFSSISLSFFGNFKLENLFPVFDTTVKNFTLATFYVVGNACESILLLAILTSSMPVSKKRGVWIAKGLFIVWALSYTLALLFFAGIMPVRVIESISASGIEVAKIIHIGESIRGVEILIFAAYQIQAVLKITIYLYCIQQASIKIFNRKKNKLFLGAAAVLIFIPAIWMNSYNKAYYLAVFLYQYILLPFCVFLLLIASISAVIMGKPKKAVKPL